MIEKGLLRSARLCRVKEEREGEREIERERANCVSAFVSVGCFVGVALRSCAGILRAAVQKRGISGSSCVAVRGLLVVDGTEESRDRSALAIELPHRSIKLPSSMRAGFASRSCSTCACVSEKGRHLDQLFREVFNPRMFMFAQREYIDWMVSLQ